VTGFLAFRKPGPEWYGGRLGGSGGARESGKGGETDRFGLGSLARGEMHEGSHLDLRDTEMPHPVTDTGPLPTLRAAMRMEGRNLPSV
jgi:hypothetical protein